MQLNMQNSFRITEFARNYYNDYVYSRKATLVRMACVPKARIICVKQLASLLATQIGARSGKTVQAELLNRFLSRMVTLLTCFMFGVI